MGLEIDWARLLEVLKSVPTMPLMSMERIYWVYLLTAAVMAFGVYLHRKRRGKNSEGFLGFLLPRRIYTHASSWVDFKYMFINKLVKLACLLPIFLLYPLVFRFSQWLLSGALGPAPAPAGLPPESVLLVYTILTALVLDLSAYVAHLLQHKVKFLWEFHKVHHSAQVLSPMTVYRVHPVDDMLGAFLMVAGTSGLHGVFAYWFPTGLSPVTFGGLNVAIFLFYILGYNLRHSHVWLSYGRAASHIFMSPAQHQIHHSKNSQHFDKNMGFMLSLWDWMFGTLHIPTAEDEETLEFGLGDDEEREFSSVWKLYSYPVKRVLGKLRNADDS